MIKMSETEKKSHILIAYNDKCYDEAESYLIKRVFRVTTKIKGAVIEKSLDYFNEKNELIAITNQDERKIELTDKIDEETFLGLKSILINEGGQLKCLNKNLI